LGIYVGHSPGHAGNILLIYNPDTTHTSPQYHCIIDDGFSSLPSSEEDSRNTKERRSWEPSINEDADEKTPTHYYFDSFWNGDCLSPSRDADGGSSNIRNPHTGNRANDADTAPSRAHNTATPAVYAATASSTESQTPRFTEATYKRKLPGYDYGNTTSHHDDFVSYKRRKGVAGMVISFPRIHRQPQMPREEYQSELASAYLAAAEELCSDTTQHLLEDAAQANVEPHCFVSEIGNEDTLTRSKMLKADDKSEFLSAEVKEIAGLTKQGV
jgi:hypothetical protein